MVLNKPGPPVSELIYLSCLVITKICPELKVVYDTVVAPSKQDTFKRQRGCYTKPLLHLK